MLQGSDCCVPLVWKKEPTLRVCSRDGYARKTWRLPPEWGQVQGARMAKVAVHSITPGGAAEVKDGELPLALAARAAEVVNRNGSPFMRWLLIAERGVH